METIRINCKDIVFGHECSRSQVDLRDGPEKYIHRQTLTFTKAIKYEGDSAHIKMVIRFDDNCGNRHESFSMTGDINKSPNFHDDHFIVGGCIHDELAKYFPEFKHLLRWHLVSVDSPMHYVANTLYHVSDKDCWGYRKGEPCRWDYHLQFAQFPITYEITSKFRDWLLANVRIRDHQGQGKFGKITFVQVDHDIGGKNYPHYYPVMENTRAVKWQPYSEAWADAPFKTQIEAEQVTEAMNKYPFEIVKVVTGYSEGKERNLDYARGTAIWPDATDEQLLDPNLEQVLLARLPTLNNDFKDDMLSLGFIYPDLEERKRVIEAKAVTT